jgi:DNA-directed RNA polymerase specialized sigma subunit
MCHFFRGGPPSLIILLIILVSGLIVYFLLKKGIKKGYIRHKKFIKNLDQQIVKLLKEKNGQITTLDLTEKTGIPLKEAKEKLDELTRSGFLGIDSDENGNIFYTSKM